uniref:Uncharacterized protein n=1 Tax=viral metagenome TaxID=1070528 RepID=A0A6C0BCX0_9ZZZZ
MSYFIRVNGKIAELFVVDNLNNVKKSVEMFSLFDDSKINLKKTHQDIIKLDRDFQIRFYISNHECIFDSYMFACLLGNYDLILQLSNYRGETNLRANETYPYGVSTITPFGATCQNLFLNGPNKQEILDYFLEYSDYDLDKADIFGKKYVCDEVSAYIRDVNNN